VRIRNIDVPGGSSFTGAASINNDGLITGIYFDSGSAFHGFIDQNGTLTLFDAPLAGQGAGQGTVVVGVDDAGQIAGSYVDALGVDHGFLLDHGVYSVLNDPLGIHGTTVSAINSAGQIVGYFLDTNFVLHGFRYSGGSNGTFSTYMVPFSKGTQIQGINAGGAIVGEYTDGNGTIHGFSYDNGSFKTLDDPLATNGTDANGINDLGQIVGEYMDGTGTHGFLYAGGVYTNLSGPIGSSSLVPQGINDGGRLVGAYPDATFHVHGFETLATPNDLNGDGTADVLWRNGNGGLADWSMNGASINGSGVTYQGNPITPDASWSIAGAADFNGDGKVDQLWRQSSGALAMWLMNGSTVTSSTSITFQGSALVPDASWSVAGTGDFNADGSADLLWRQSSGTLAIWDMNGATATSSSTVTYQGGAIVPDASWSVAGVGDFNSNGCADILWRQGSGALAIWDMNGSTVTSSSTVTFQGGAIAPDASWGIAGIGDFNSDGNADILWRQASTGSLALWLMNGSAVKSSAAITYQGNVVSPDASWKIVEIGDFNNDGSSDILWRNDNGAMTQWIMNGSQIMSTATPSAQGSPIAPDANWNVQAKPTNFG
jgi:probable HAF family extracellular repeat protein